MYYYVLSPNYGGKERVKMAEHTCFHCGIKMASWMQHCVSCRVEQPPPAPQVEAVTAYQAQPELTEIQLLKQQVVAANKTNNHLEALIKQNKRIAEHSQRLDTNINNLKEDMERMSADINNLRITVCRDEGEALTKSYWELVKGIESNTSGLVIFLVWIPLILGILWLIFAV